ncbi:MAG: gliding motility-associated C-terminal domain-containing protein [Bacteroidetes bacterium]|nr:gliding motility-associated C-terminal domain-containing protein [Bacteroidota bacterium]
MGAKNFFLKKLRVWSVFSLLTLSSFQIFAADITLSFCPVSKIQASKDWSATFTIQNNTGVVLDFVAGSFDMNWPSLVLLPYPFARYTQSGIDWKFGIDGVYSWDSKLPVGATYTKAFTGGKFSGVLQFPTSGTFTQNGITYTVAVSNCNTTQNYELFDATFEFKRDCFIKSPTKLCLGEGASEVWFGEGIYDAMIPKNRPSWAIAVMVGHRLFTNLSGLDMVSPNFWLATALNESRMTCDGAIIPNTISNYGLNSMPPLHVGTEVRSPNCFQVLNIGYTQISDNQPDLFAQTNQYGTATYSNVVDNGNWETGAIAVAYYHYQDMRYWDQIYCFNIPKTWKDSKDSYAVEKIFYHAYHDGPNAGLALLNDIKGNYNAAVNATNMNTVISTGGTWSSINAGGSSQKVGNFTSLLDGGNGNLYPVTKSDNTIKYHGCYNAPIKWTDVLYYLDRIKILYPKVKTAAVENAIKAVFDGINGGADVNFEDMGTVIDEIVFQLGGHDPSKYIATQFAGSKTCGTNALGVSLRTNDTICPGTTGTLQVWLSGDKNFKFTLKYPDGSLNTFSNVDYSPYNVPITQPGKYEVTYFEDNDEIGDPNCLFSSITVQSKNGNVVTWDKSNVTGVGAAKCATGDLILKNTGPNAVAITYTKDGGAPVTVNFSGGQTTKTIASPGLPGQYIIKTMTPNTCGTPILDTITICNTACTKPTATISGGATICAGDSTQLSVALTGTSPWKIKLNDGTVKTYRSGITTIPYTFYVKTAGAYKIDSVWDATCSNIGVVATATVVVNPLPTIAIAGDTSICPGGTASLTLTLTGTAPYSIKAIMGITSVTLNAPGNTYVVPLSVIGAYTLEVTDAKGCKQTKQVTIINETPPTVSIGDTIKFCPGGSTPVSVPAGFASYLWSTSGTTNSITVNAATVSPVWIEVTDANGCKDRDSAVTKQGQLSVNIGPADTTICFGSSVTLNGGTGFSTYSWTGAKTGSGQTIVANAGGTYNLTVTDASSCSATDAINVHINPQVTFSLGSSDTLFICPGGSVTITPVVPAGAFTYLWSNKASGTATTFAANTEGWYTLKITDALGCYANDSVYVKENSKLVFSLSDKTICVGDSIVLNPGYSGAGYTFAWNTGDVTPTKTVKTAGVYGLVVTYNGSCSGSDSMNLFMHPLADVDLGADSIFICPGATTSIDAGGAFAKYVWSSSEQTKVINNKGANKYVVTVTDANGCADKDSVIVSARPIIAVNLGDDIDTCAGVNITLLNSWSQSGVTYKWTKLSTGNTSLGTSATLAISQNDTYTLTVTDAYTCSNTDVVVANFRTVPVVDLWPTDTAVICAGNSLDLDAGNAGLKYSWNTNETTQTISASGEGLYYVTVSNAMCKDKDSVYVHEITLPQSVLNDTLNAVLPNYCFAEESVVISAASMDNITYTYLWSTGESTPSIIARKEAVYSVTISADNCSVTDQIEVIDYCPAVFNLPNAFTPNGDGNNETFFVAGQYLEDFELLIFNRWGELIYKSNDYKAHWDGNYRGKKVEQDVYVWKVHYAVNLPNGNNQDRDRIGHVTVIY